MRATDWTPLLEDHATAPTVAAMARWLWTRGWLSGRASLGDLEALAELHALDPLAAQLLQSQLPNPNRGPKNDP